MGVCVGQAREQLLRLRFRHRDGAAAELLDHRISSSCSRAGSAPRRSRLRDPVRDRRGGSSQTDVDLNDLRYALRFLWGHKAFSATAVLTLAIGLGANTALFGFLNAVLRPLPLPAAERLVAIVAEPKGDDTGGFQFSFSTEQMEDLQKRAEPFSDVVGFMARVGGFSANGQAAQFWFGAVSENYFSGLGVRPAAGVLFSQRSGSPVHLVLGHSFWKRQFGGDPAVVGTTARVNGGAAVIVGVVEPAFRGTMTGVEMDGYIVVNDYGFITPEVNK